MSAELAGNAYVEMSVKGQAQFAKSFTEMQSRIRVFGNALNQVNSANKTSTLRKGLSSLLGGFKQLTAAALKYGSIAGVALGAGVTAYLAASIKKASDLQETMNKFNVVFAENAAGMDRWGTSFAKAMGRSKNETKKMLADLQGFLRAMGVAPDQSARMSQALTQLSYDLASFNNVADEEAFTALMSAISGEAEPMKRFGVVVNDAAMKAELLKRGLDPDTATEAQKAMARYNVILQGTALAQGDVQRSSQSYANQLKALQAAWDDLSAQVGTVFIPYAQVLLGMLKELVVDIGKHTGALDLASVSTNKLSESSGGLMSVLSGLLKFWNGIATAINSVVYLMQEFLILLLKANKLAGTALSYTPAGLMARAGGYGETHDQAIAMLDAATKSMEEGRDATLKRLENNVDFAGPNGIQDWMASIGEEMRKAREMVRQEMQRQMQQAAQQGGAGANLNPFTNLGPGVADPKDAAKAQTAAQRAAKAAAAAAEKQRRAEITKRKKEIDAQILALKETAREVASPQALERTSVAAFEKFKENQQNEQKAIQEKQLKQLEKIKKALDNPNIGITVVGG